MSLHWVLFLAMGSITVTQVFKTIRNNDQNRSHHALIEAGHRDVWCSGLYSIGENNEWKCEIQVGAKWSRGMLAIQGEKCISKGGAWIRVAVFQTVAEQRSTQQGTKKHTPTTHTHNTPLSFIVSPTHDPFLLGMKNDGSGAGSKKVDGR